MYNWIKSAEHAKLIRTFLLVKLHAKKFSVRKSRYTAIDIFCNESDYDVLRSVLSAWRTGGMGMFDNYEHKEMFMGVDPETGCTVIWNSAFVDKLQNPERVSVVVDWICVQSSMF